MEEVILINRDPNVRVPSFGEWLDIADEHGLINVEEELDIPVQFSEPIQSWKCVKRVSDTFYLNPTAEFETIKQIKTPVKVAANSINIPGLEYLDTYAMEAEDAIKYGRGPNTIIEGRTGLPLLNCGGSNVKSVIEEISENHSCLGAMGLEWQIMLSVRRHGLSPRYEWITMGGEKIRYLTDDEYLLE